MHIETFLDVVCRVARRHATPAALAVLFACAQPARGDPPVAAAVPFDALVAEALAHNPEIRAAQLEYQAALERRAPAQALDDPMFEFGVVNAALPFSLRRDDMTMQMLGLSQKLPFPGKRRLREAVAGADADAIGHAADETTNRVVRDLHHAYADLQLADRSTAIVTRTLETLRALASVATSRYSVGKASQADVLQAGARIAQVQQALLHLRADRQAANSEIRRLSNRTDSIQSIVSAPTAGLHESPDADGDGAARPQLAALRAMEARGELELELAERNYYPDVELRLGYGHRDRSLEGIPRDDVVTMTFAVNLPLWRKSRLAPRVAEARALRARAAAMAEGQRLETRAGIEQQAARETEARDTAALYRSTLLPQAHAETEATRAAWESGSGNLTAVLDATIREYQAMLAEADALSARVRARAEIDFLNGVAPHPATGVLP